MSILIPRGAYDNEGTLTSKDFLCVHMNNAPSK